MHNDSLLELIETFTPSEKNNFKRYIAFTGGGRLLKYEVLYNLYNKHLNKGYDKTTFEKKVLNALKKNPHLKKDLNNVRKRLKDKLLESLAIQGSSKSKIEDITKGINEVRILVERKLYKAATQKLNQLKNKAQSYNLNKCLIELSEIEISIMIRSSNKDDEVKLQLLIDAQQNYLHLYSVELNLNNIFVTINSIVEKDLQLSKKGNLLQLNELFKKLEKIDIQKHAENQQIRIVLWYYRIKNVFYRSVDKGDLAYKNCEKLIFFFEQNDELLKNFQEEYVKVICSFSRTCFQLNREKELDHLISKVRNLYEHQKNYTALEATCDMGVLHFLNSFQYDKADEIANLMNENWSYFESKTMDGKLLWYAHTNSILYWILEDQQKLLLWVERGLDINRPHKGKMFFFGIRMIMLTHHYDTNELLHFNEKVQALQKTMSNNDDLKEFEKLVLQYIKKIANVKMSAKPKKEKASLSQILFKEFKASLLALQDGKTNFIAPINYEEILIWCETHLQNKSIKEVFETF